jgi:hypothetical protein
MSMIRKNNLLKVIALSILFIPVFGTFYPAQAGSIGNPSKTTVAPGETFTIELTEDNSTEQAYTNVISEVHFGGCNPTATVETRLTCKSIDGQSCSGNIAKKSFGTINPGQTKTAKITLTLSPDATPGKNVAVCLWRSSSDQTPPSDWRLAHIFVQVGGTVIPTATATVKPTTTPKATLKATTSPTIQPTATEIVTPEVTETTSITPSPTEDQADPTPTAKSISTYEGVFKMIGFICLGLLVLLVIVGVILFFWFKKKKKKENQSLPKPE